MRPMRWFAVLVTTASLVACLDPTTATPPPPGSPVPAFQAHVYLVTAGDVPATWHAGCPVGPSSLRRLSVSHWGFDGLVHTGDLIVHRDAVDAMVRVLHRLYDVRY